MVALGITDSELVVRLNLVNRAASFRFRDIHVPLGRITDVFVTRKPIPAVTSDITIPRWAQFSRGTGGSPSGLGTLQAFALESGEGKCFIAVWLNRPSVVVEASDGEFRRLVVSRGSPQLFVDRLREAARAAGAHLVDPSEGEQLLHKTRRPSYDDPRHLS
jgi:hypothetical protein